VKIRIGRGGAGPAALALGAGLAAAAAGEGAGLPAREARIYQQVCAVCHAREGIGVPVTGDAAAWEARRARGLDSLFENTVNGTRGMPPLGTCSFCTEDELRRLVAYVAGLPLPEETR
jgi:cytochrome c5